MTISSKVKTPLALLLLACCGLVPKLNAQELQARPILIENLQGILGVAMQDGQIENPRPCTAVPAKLGLLVTNVRTESLLGRREIKSGYLLVTSAKSQAEFWSTLSISLNRTASIELQFSPVETPKCEIKIGNSCGEQMIANLKSCAAESFGKLKQRFTLAELEAELVNLQARKTQLRVPETTPTYNVGNRLADKRFRNADLLVQHLNYINDFSPHYRAALSYFAWCCKDKKRGPTKSDKVVGRLSQILKDPDAALSSTGDDLHLDRLTQLEEELRTVSVRIRGLIDRARNYYNSNAYAADDFEEGRAIHAVLSPLLLQFLDVYKKLLGAELEMISVNEETLFKKWSRTSEMQAARGSLFLIYRKFLFGARTNATERQLRSSFSEMKQKLAELVRISPPESDFAYFSSAAYGFVAEVKLLIDECNMRFLSSGCVVPPREDYRLE